MKLIDGEEVTFSDLKNDKTKEISDETINEKYVKGEVRIVTEQARYPLSTIPTLVISDSYLLTPEFQRRHRWSVSQKSRLIESFIMNVPIPPIFLYEDSYGHYEVMDGLQRLSAIKEFYADSFTLEDLVEWPELNGKSYSTLPSQIKKGVDRRYLSSIILLKETASNQVDENKLKQLVFDRINSGGVQLEDQESRNAIFNGPFNLMCIKASRNPFFCRAWGIPEPETDYLSSEIETITEEMRKNELYRKMVDVELVLRFFANRQREKLIKNSYLKQYLDKYLQNANQFEERTISELKNLFDETVEFLYDLLGESAFFFYRERNDKWYWLNRPVTAVYDPLMIVASNFLDKKDEILKSKQNIKKVFEDFYKEKYNIFEGRNTTQTIFKEREKAFAELFKSFLKR
ncbi:DUF262 domain-containing protein [Pedobacter sp. MC2016-14]|nr:DUF262 domain-containing protein [Pedobacter sp. MC2016-14]MCD0489672.1 DUF262 domain-containing protein [Pedobacter sp. MC2016-14]